VHLRGSCVRGPAWRGVGGAARFVGCITDTKSACICVAGAGGSPS